jgi:predicted RNA-binding protein with RPS1 domain
MSLRFALGKNIRATTVGARPDEYGPPQLAWREREACVGRLVGFHYGEEGGQQPQGLCVEVAPGKTGFLPAAALGRFRAQRMALLKPGEEIAVQVASLNAGKISLALPAPIVQVGQHFVGYVAGFLPGTYGHARAGVFVELFPDGADSLIHHSRLPAYILKTLDVGDRVRVKVVAVDVGAKGRRYKLRLI